MFTIILLILILIYNLFCLMTMDEDLDSLRDKVRILEDKNRRKTPEEIKKFIQA